MPITNSSRSDLSAIHQLTRRTLFFFGTDDTCSCSTGQPSSSCASHSAQLRSNDKARRISSYRNLRACKPPKIPPPVPNPSANNRACRYPCSSTSGIWSQSKRINKRERTTEDIAVRANSSHQPNRITLHIPPSARLVIAEVVLIEPTQRIVAPPKKAHIEHERRPVLVRILVRGGGAEGFALQVPAPDRHVANRVDDGTRRAQVVRLHIAQRGLGQHADRQIVQPDRLLHDRTIGVVIQSVAFGHATGSTTFS
ncbi:hypothetical protein NB688_002743 [Xanthomonas sacchari]|uniref:Uncharacterized protein n=1 Tax=Xanthomonas sacchari TaxID=56458 RepID=A0ABT3DW07_9XANT|nr:hypothetical protein [Xanthomonas sacchari]MCW0420577.1 hypothetical protein [Xanthomonas sacchari]